MRLTIDKQKEYLSKKLVIESLRENKENKEQIKEFVQANGGVKLYEYLVKNAWEDDDNRETKVFLVKVHSAEPSGLRCVSERTLCGA